MKSIGNKSNNFCLVVAACLSPICAAAADVFRTQSQLSEWPATFTEGVGYGVDACSHAPVVSPISLADAVER
jgi:hypothetical protein